MTYKFSTKNLVLNDDHNHDDDYDNDDDNENEDKNKQKNIFFDNI